MNQPYAILGIALWVVAALMIAFATDAHKSRPWHIRLVRGMMPAMEAHPLARHWRFVQAIGGIWILGGYLLGALAGNISPDWLITVFAYLLWGIPPLILLWYTRRVTRHSNNQTGSGEK